MYIVPRSSWKSLLEKMVSGIIEVKSRSKNLKDVKLELGKGAFSYENILKHISKANRNINVNRLRLTYSNEGKQVAIEAKTLKEDAQFAEEHSVWYVKDLGPQISWRLVFLVEYAGPILVHSLIYYLSLQPAFVEKFHSKSVEYNGFLNKLAYQMITAHYTKRLLETIFVHSFSQSTMPFFNLFKNSFHYWILNGSIAIGYFGYGFPMENEKLFKLYEQLKINDLKRVVVFFALSEFWNLYCHIKLRLWGDAQKKKGITKRIPIEEGIFRIFVSPNYTFEFWSFFWFTIAFKLNLFAVFFLIVSTTQMYLWAQKKNKRYGTKRAFLVPYIF